MRRRSLYALIASSCLLVVLGCVQGRPAPPSSPGAAPDARATSAPTPNPPATTRDGSGLTATPAPSAPLVVRAARTQGVGNILHLAAARGYFREYGIELDRVEFRNAAEALPPLTTGEIDVGSSAPVPSFINALARGIRLTLALDASHVDPAARGYPMIARLQDGKPVVQQLSDLRGKRVAHSTPGYPAEPALERMLAEAGLSTADLGDNQYMGFPETLAAFASGHMDIAIVPEPWGAIAEDRGVGARVFDVSEYIRNNQVAMIVYSEKFGRERTDAARRFAVAYLRAAREYADAWEHGRDRDAVLAILAESANVPVHVLQRSGYLAVRRDGRVNSDALVNWVDWLADHGYVPQKPDILSLIDHQFADYARSVLDGSR